MKFEFKRGKKKFVLDAHECSFFEKFSGLMFTKKKNAKPLLFEFKNNSKTSLHSLFVFFKFLVLWLDEKNNIVDMKICRPWKFYINTKKSFSKILEIPVNEKYEKIINELIK